MLDVELALSKKLKAQTPSKITMRLHAAGYQWNLDWSWTKTKN